MPLPPNQFYNKVYKIKVSKSKVSIHLEDIISYVFDTYPEIASFNLVDYDICRKYAYIYITHVIYIWEVR